MRRGDLVNVVPILELTVCSSGSELPHQGQWHGHLGSPYLCLINCSETHITPPPLPQRFPLSSQHTKQTT